MKIIKN